MTARTTAVGVLKRLRIPSAAPRTSRCGQPPPNSGSQRPQLTIAGSHVVHIMAGDGAAEAFDRAAY